MPTLTLYVGDLYTVPAIGIPIQPAMRPKVADGLALEVEQSLKSGFDVTLAMNCCNAIDALPVYLVRDGGTFKVIERNLVSGPKIEERVWIADEWFWRSLDAKIQHISDILRTRGVWT